jgi:hypothetical protein
MAMAMAMDGMVKTAETYLLEKLRRDRVRVRNGLSQLRLSRVLLAVLDLVGRTTFVGFARHFEELGL